MRTTNPPPRITSTTTSIAFNANTKYQCQHHHRSSPSPLPHQHINRYQRQHQNQTILLFFFYQHQSTPTPTPKSNHLFFFFFTNTKSIPQSNLFYHFLQSKGLTATIQQHYNTVQHFPRSDVLNKYEPGNHFRPVQRRKLPNMRQFSSGPQY